MESIEEYLDWDDLKSGDIFKAIYRVGESKFREGVFVYIKMAPHLYWVKHTLFTIEDMDIWRLREVKFRKISELKRDKLEEYKAKYL